MPPIRTRRDFLALSGASLLLGGAAAPSAGLAGTLLAQAPAGGAQDYQPQRGQSGKDVIWIPTPDKLVSRMLSMAQVTASDFVIDLGAGDGKIVIAAAREFGARGLGIEYEPQMVEHARRNAQAAGVADRARFEKADIFESDFSPASVITMYLLPHLNMRLRHRMMALEPGTRVLLGEYGNGIIGDMGVHMLDAVRWLLDLGWPKRVSSSGGIFVDKASRANIPDTQTATFEFDDLTVVWEHRTWGAPPDPRYPWGLVLHGDKGTLKAGVERYEFIPVGGTEPARSATFLDEADQFPADKTEKRIEIHAAPATRRHFRNLLACIADGSKPVADIEQGHISSASCILANIALGLGRPLSYDPATRSVPGDAEATAALRRPYRAPWRHPAG